MSRLLFWLAIIAIVVMTLSQLLGRYVWQLELFSHYVPHLAVLTLLAWSIFPNRDALFVKATLSYRFFIRTIMAIVGISLAVWSLQPFSLISNMFTSDTSIKPNLSNHMTIAYQNVNINNSQTNQTLQQLVNLSSHSNLQPDVVALVEAGGSNWHSTLIKLAKYYPSHCGNSESSPFAMQVFTKNMASHCNIIMLSGFPVARLEFSGAPSIHLASDDLSDTDLSDAVLSNAKLSQTSTDAIAKQSDSLTKQKVLYVAHPPPPLGRNFASLRNQYLQQLAKLIKSDQHYSVMVVGDFNLSAFSPVYRDFMSQSKADASYLRRTTITGLPTWRPFGIGIDQVLVNSNEASVNTKAMDWKGSDHRGFIIKWW
ncbi:endonuclease/exonuclease/phosphatase family protein [Psychrobacter sp.]|uniref:endonuclease/exonuclease/phosphatase family protein n=1 Tax=Psychrobacter sp. TaxID=56811 RepID=UPI0025F2C0C0|nr:endonuclease/exonuclease/phosphatase family protein [Psychrobacter sp.]